MITDFNVKYIPVFYHVPKCAGTYIKGQILSGLNQLLMSQRPRLKSVWLEFNSTVIAELYVVCRGSGLDKSKYVNLPSLKSANHRRLMRSIKYEHFIGKYKELNIDVVAVNINSDGFWMHEHICDFVKLAGGKGLQKYMIMRSPFERACSNFNYLKSSNSSHEKAHGSLKSISIQDYLVSKEVESGWLLKCFAKPQHVANYCVMDNFEHICRILDKFTIRDIKDCDRLIKLIFSECFSHPHDRKIYIDEELGQRNSNKSSGFTPILEFLDDRTKEKTLENLKYDNMLYDRFVGNYYETNI